MTSWAPRPASEVVARALSARGQGYYKLGGGAPYTEASPFDADGNPHPGTCDCSGLIAWAAGYRRDAWNTNAIVADALKRRTRFVLVPRMAAVRVGDIIVKPGPDLDHDGRRDYPGHCGIIVGVHADFVRGGPEWWEDLDVAHCSGARQNRIDPTTGKRYGAVRVTDASLWALSGYIIRPLHLT